MPKGIESKCEICGQIFLSKTKLIQHLKTEHSSVSTTQYYDLIHNTKSICMKCGNEAYTTTYFSKPRKYCKKHSAEFNSHWTIWYYLSRGFTEEEAKNKIRLIQQKNSYNGNKKYSKKILMAEGYSEEEAEQIVKERLKQNPKRRDHYASDEEYYAELNRFAECQRIVYKKKIKGYYSCWSKNFYKYQNLSEDEKYHARNKVAFSKENPNLNIKKFKEKCNTCLEYYLNQGMSLEKAKEAQRQRNSTFSLKKCIEKYGEEGGTKRFKARREKWLNSLNKNPENKEKIERGRIKGIEVSHRGYSKIGLMFFKSIINNIDLSNYTVFYKDPDNKKIEKCIYTESGPKFLDFYIKELNFAIEFDGTYWHKNKEEGDKLRDQYIKNKIKNLQIIHIKENDYNKNRYECLLSVLKIIKELKENYERINCA